MSFVGSLCFLKNAFSASPRTTGSRTSPATTTPAFNGSRTSCTSSAAPLLVTVAAAIWEPPIFSPTMRLWLRDRRGRPAPAGPGRPVFFCLFAGGAGGGGGGGGRRPGRRPGGGGSGGRQGLRQLDRRRGLRSDLGLGGAECVEVLRPGLEDVGLLVVGLRLGSGVRRRRGQLRLGGAQRLDPLGPIAEDVLLLALRA